MEVIDSKGHNPANIRVNEILVTTCLPLYIILNRSISATELTVDIAMTS